MYHLTPLCYYVAYLRAGIICSLTLSLQRCILHVACYESGIHISLNLSQYLIHLSSRNVDCIHLYLCLIAEYSLSHYIFYISAECSLPIRPHSCTLPHSPITIYLLKYPLHHVEFSRSL